MLDEFINTKIDEENQNSKNIQDDEEFADENVEQKKLKLRLGVRILFY